MYKLLIVEDEKLLRQGLIHITYWMEHGYIITGEASNGEEALRCIENCMPDIVVTDIVMPVMDGIELTRILREKYPRIQIIILSSYSEFNYVREVLRLGAADYILKQEIDSEKLLNSLSKVSENIRNSQLSQNTNSVSDIGVLQNQLFLNLLSSQSPKMTSIRNLMEQSKLNLKEEDLRLIIYIPRISNLNISVTANSSMSFLKNILLGYMESLQNPYTFTTADNTLVLLFNDNSDELEKVHTLVQQSVQNILISYNIPLVAVISSHFDSLSQLQAIYIQTLKASEYLFFNSEKEIILWDNLKDKQVKLELDYKNFHPFVETLRLTELVNEVFKFFSNFLEAGYYFEVYEVKRTLVELVNFIIFQLNEMSFNINEIENVRFEYIQILESASSFSALIEEFKKIMEAFRLSIDGSQNKQTCEIVQQAREYILQNYNREISLSTTADYLHINKSYLSELFKEQTGENFSDCVIRIRMDKAKDIFKCKNLPVSTVGEQVGYPNTSYFIQLFKKIVGMKPLEYSRLFRKY
ncbi:MAG: hypothetical protein A2Y21_07335 [Clostridiales bacterium GWC2_40_7]|nr:MAG: hypothetical protein A2Y21_07335 [Clostridiales bacterium GWC2_40_7]